LGAGEMKRAIWRYFVAVTVIIAFAMAISHYNKPVVKVQPYNNSPANLEDGLGNKLFKSADLPREKYKKVYKYIIRCDDATSLDSENYLKRFKADVARKTENSGGSSAIILSDYRPNFEKFEFVSPEEGFKAWQECKARAKWLRE
jgi:hypothetical protein